MKNELYENMYERYKDGLSLSEVGKEFGITRQSVYTGFKVRSFELRKKNEQPFQILDGIKFTLRNHGYFAATTGKRQQMHRYVWEKHFGEIPKGYDIHHKDHNRTNNDISNLELLTKSEHASKYNTGSNQYVKRGYKIYE